MKELIKISLRSGKDESLRRNHPWVFSGAIKKMTGEPSEGDLVAVYSNKEEFLGMGHYGLGSIAVRIISFEEKNIDKQFWADKIRKAYEMRVITGVAGRDDLNVFRLIYAEGDGLPGLVVDYYNGTCVLQCHSRGMYDNRKLIVEALLELKELNIKAVFDKSAESLFKNKPEFKNEYLYGSRSEEPVNEYGHEFLVDWETGQKTGFFIDQRENRELLKKFCKDKMVLNTFCYTGGFSIYALKAGAKEVHSVDSSKKAIELTDKNVQHNGFSDRHKSFAVDTFDFLEGKEDVYDVIILDPPAFAKHMDARHHAVMGYKRINSEALKRIRKGGVLFTFSCSQVIDKRLFENTIMSAAIVAKRNARIIGRLTQPADHPVNIFHPEGEYLKGLAIYVE
jgi:23S rRNA (cytosine1962-C5)-methyltransferase